MKITINISAYNHIQEHDVLLTSTESLNSDLSNYIGENLNAKKELYIDAFIGVMFLDSCIISLPDYKKQLNEFCVKIRLNANEYQNHFRSQNICYRDNRDD